MRGTDAQETERHETRDPILRRYTFQTETRPRRYKKRLETVARSRGLRPRLLYISASNTAFPQQNIKIDFPRQLTHTLLTSIAKVCEEFGINVVEIYKQSNIIRRPTVGKHCEICFGNWNWRPERGAGV